MRFSKLLGKYPRIFLISHMGVWFVIGMVISYLVMQIPIFNRPESLNIGLGFAGLLALIVGLLGGVFILLNYSEKNQSRDFHFSI
ncbi:MAG: hypothetical protein ACERKZ_12670 [Lachnotalea sp.]